MTPYFMQLPMLLAEWWDAFAWKNIGWYRRREMRKRMILSVVAAPVCEWCGSPIEVVMLRNGGRICMSCQDGYR